MMVFDLWSPISFCMSCRETNDWTIPESVKPRISAQRVAQNMKNASSRLCPTTPGNSVTIAPSQVCPRSSPLSLVGCAHADEILDDDRCGSGSSTGRHDELLRPGGGDIPAGIKALD